MTLVAGIDEAGRGPVIGPLVICCFVCEEEKLPLLKKLGVRDSKLLSPSRRRELFKELKQVGKPIIKEITANQIDKWMDSGKNLNLLELTVMGALIEDCGAGKVFVDAIEANEAKVKEKLKALFSRKVKLTAKNKADVKYPVVGAASICAKVTRDKRVAAYRQKFGDLGSGYPADPRTQAFLRKWAKTKKPFPIIVRKNWATAKNLVGEAQQMKLGDWSE